MTTREVSQTSQLNEPMSASAQTTSYAGTGDLQHATDGGNYASGSGANGELQENPSERVESGLGVDNTAKVDAIPRRTAPNTDQTAILPSSVSIVPPGAELQLNGSAANGENGDNTSEERRDSSCGEIKVDDDPGAGDEVGVVVESSAGGTAPTHEDQAGVLPSSDLIARGSTRSSPLERTTNNGEQSTCVAANRANRGNSSDESKDLTDPGDKAAVDDSPPIVPLKDLKPNISSLWAFVAQVIARNPVRSWKTWQDNGTLMHVFVADTADCITRITLFNEAVEIFSNVVSPGSTCYFSGGRVKRAFASRNGDVEISFGKGSMIRKAPSPLGFSPELASEAINELVMHSAQSTVTTIAVIHAVGGLKRIVTKKGKTIEKRELLLVDDSDTSLVCTTWGQLAYESGDISDGTVVIVMNGILSDYNNIRSVSIGVGSDILHEPTLPRSDELRQWYSKLADNHSFSPLASK